jgi:hypothetical protein
VGKMTRVYVDGHALVMTLWDRGPLSSSLARNTVDIDLLPIQARCADMTRGLRATRHLNRGGAQ